MDGDLAPPEKRLPLSPAPDVSPRDDVRVASSLTRCPYCHTSVSPTGPSWVACEKCLARHHAACWGESGRCASCGGESHLRAERPSLPRGARVAAVVVCLGVALAVAGFFAASRSAPRGHRLETRTPTFDQHHAIALLGQAESALAANELERAIADATEALSNDPTFVQAWALRGRARLARDDARGALADFDKAFAADPDARIPGDFRGDLHRLRASARRSLGDADGALADSTKAVELNPREAAAWASRGVAYLDKGDARKAVQDLTRAIELDGKLVAAYLERSRAHEALGEIGAARADLECVLALVPPSSEMATSVRSALGRLRRD